MNQSSPAGPPTGAEAGNQSSPAGPPTGAEAGKWGLVSRISDISQILAFVISVVLLTLIIPAWNRITHISNTPTVISQPANATEDLSDSFAASGTLSTPGGLCKTRLL